MENIKARFVSQKISKTRWRPEPASSLQPPDLFAVGSWDNEENKVSIWSTGDFGTINMDEDYLVEPKLLCDIRHRGDVTDLQFLDQERIVTASSTGRVTIFRHHQTNQTLSEKQKWEHAHSHAGSNDVGAPCTGIVCSSPDIVSVGEDGRINVFKADSKDIVRTIDDADSSTMHAVTFLRTTEILTVNSIGQLKMWDLRQQGNDPTQIFSVANERVPLHCLNRHPSQQHVVATGGQDGMLCIWDVRQSKIPVSLLSAHDAEMWEVHFHPSKPDHIFTCSEDGSLWHWDASTEAAERPNFLVGGRGNSHLSRSTLGQSVNQSLMTAWLSSDPTKGHLEITNLMPSSTLSVNSLDVLGEYLVCGTDSESIYVFKNLFT
ncbi:PREDICTED: nucleoporin Nup43 [Nanorana parkeri]|uniref:nucleoporin Nup43 n=1 Tax=Nanorana parkeri TaxID=125878 RepID=UPI000854D1B1|nr:PREDICTED: nucleoporin Nup43 [Nanorana parkeri]